MKTLAMTITVLMTLAPARAVVSVWCSINDSVDPWESVETVEEETITVSSSFDA